MLFENGRFGLPALSNGKDKYTIEIFTVAKPKEVAKKLELPAGIGAVEVVAAALPKETWRWRFIVERAELPKVEALFPADERLSYEQLARYDDAVLLVWKHLPGTASYRVTVETDKAKRQSSPPDWGKADTKELPAIEDEFVINDQGFYPLPLKVGARVRWKVAALDQGKVPVAESDFKTIAVDEPWSTAAVEGGLKLRRSDTLSPDNASKAALLGYTSNQEGKAARARNYHAEFALIWESKEAGLGGLYPRVSLEANLRSAGEDKGKDVLRFRAGGSRPLADVNLQLVTNLKYDTERKSGTKKGSLEFTVSPTMLPFGRFYPAPGGAQQDVAGNFNPTSRPWAQLMLQTAFGGELGRTFDVGSSLETTRSLAREWIDLRIDARLNAIASLLRVPNVSLFLQSTYWHLHHQSANEFTMSKIGASLQITPEVSLELAYSVGNEPPTFEFSRLGTVGLGLKF